MTPKERHERRTQAAIKELQSNAKTPRQIAYAVIEQVAAILADSVVNGSLYGRTPSSDSADYTNATGLTEALATIRAMDELDDLRYCAELERLRATIKAQEDGLPF